MADLNFDFASLQQQLQPGAISEKKTFGPDERFWKLSRGEDDTGTAIIRLLVDKNRVPFVKVFHHQFSVYDPSKGKKRWYIEDSPQTIGLPCPVAEKWQELYNEGTEESKNKAKLFARKIKYVTNIKVINDPANPENNGKIFLWEFGTKLLDKFLAKMNPGEDDLKLGIRPVELYNPVAGANIMLKIKKSAGFFNYDDTQILDTSAEWSTMESAITEMDANTFELQEFINPEHFKSYDDLKGRMEYVLTGTKSGENSNQTQTAAAATQQTATVENTTINTGMPPAQPAQVVQQPVQTPPAQPVQNTAPKTTAPAGDDDLSFLDDL